MRTGNNATTDNVRATLHRVRAVFPLSPQVMMYCKERAFWHKLERFNDRLFPVDFTAEMVEHENAGQVFMAGRFVISPVNDFAELRDFASTIRTDRYAPARW